MEKYIPDIYQKSIHAIDYQKLYDKGIRCLLFDLDNTLVPYHVKNLNEKTISLFHDLKQMGFRILIFSNNCKSRVRPFKEQLEIDCCANARKPNIKHFERVMKTYKLNENQIAIIGDQMLTDILGGNKAGITTILINPISKRDAIWTVPNRIREKRIMEKMTKYNLFFKGRYYE